jgi:hypothetical protein
MTEPPFGIVPHSVELSEQLVLPVLGHPVRFATNDPRVLDVVRESFGAWAALDPALHVALPLATPVEIRIHVHAGTAPWVLPRYELVDADRLLLHLDAQDPAADQANGERSVGAADRTQRCAAVTLGQAHLDHPATFRYGVVEALVRFLLTGPQRLPLHGAALVRDGRALVLGARSGTGKSTLAWAALHDDWSLLAEDIVYVQPAPSHRLWGGDALLHVPTASARFFPALAHRRADVRMGDASKIAVRAPGAPALTARAMVLCAVDRGSAPSLRRADRVTVIGRLVAREPGFARHADALERALLSWPDVQTWALTLGDDPHQALPLLRAMLAG